MENVNVSLGPEGVLRALKPRLLAGSREIIDRIREERGLTAKDLPYFTQILGNPRPVASAGEYPIAMLKVNGNTGKMDNRTTSGTSTADVFRYTYRVTVLVLGLGSRMDETGALMHRLATAIRDGAVLNRNLVDSNANGDGPEARVLTTDMIVRFDDVVDTSAGFFGGAEVEFTVKTREPLPTNEGYRGGIPEAGEIAVGVQLYTFPT